MNTDSQTDDKSAYNFVNERRDQLRRSVNDKNYDPSTLYIPHEDLGRMKNMERQYWDIKRHNFDVVIFFKKGKFYELYDTDAELGSREFGLRMINDVRSTGMMMSGVPEGSFPTWAQRFISRGYKVGRVEQMPRENAKPTDAMRRELVRVYSSGTLNDTEYIHTPEAVYICAVFEETNAESARIAACAIDCSRSSGYYSLFEGSERHLQLKTFLYHLSAQEIVIPQSSFVSQELNTIIHEHKTAQCFIRWIHVPEEDLQARKTDGFLKNIAQFVGSDTPQWCTEICNQSIEVMKAFWILHQYLRKLHIASEVLNTHLSIEQFSVENDATVEPVNHMILDCHTLDHLNIIPLEGRNVTQGSGKSAQARFRSLFTRIDSTRTSAGKRLLKNWVLNPLRVHGELVKRQECVKAFMHFSNANESIQQLLRKCPHNDLERSSWKLRALVDEKNVSWVDANLQGKKICALLETTLSTASAWNAFCAKILHSKEVEKTAMGIALAGIFPTDLRTEIDEFRNTHLCHRPEDDRKTFYGNFITPCAGTNETLDGFEKQKMGYHSILDERLLAAKQTFGDEVRYTNIGKDKHLLEIPRRKHFPTGTYHEYNRTATVVREIDMQCKHVSQEIDKINGKLDEFFQDYLRRTVLGRYASMHLKILALSRVIATIDALSSIACYSAQDGMCCPDILANENGDGLFEATGLFYPETRVLGAESEKCIVQNDVSFTRQTGKTIILTGPNMGGKSTLMRSIADACILAQIGSFVHAKTCRLTPMDRIYTRIGAKDALFQGKSTFLVELTETAHILQRATRNSLVLVDELGRGTSTLDGYAIAWGALLHLVNRDCFMLFSTHYYFLAIEAIVHFARSTQNVRAMQMKYELRSGDGSVVLLHKLVPGVCSSSYGLEVARRAGIPEEITRRAEAHGRQIASTLGFDDRSMNGRLAEFLVECLSEKPHITQ